MKQELTENSVLKIAGKIIPQANTYYDCRESRLDLCRWGICIDNYLIVISKYMPLDGTYDAPSDWMEQNKFKGSCSVHSTCGGGCLEIASKYFTETVYEEDVISFIKETIKNHMEKTSDLARWVYDQEI